MTGPSVPAGLAWLQALRSPALVQAWSLDDWQRVTRLARRLRLLGRLAERIDDAGLAPGLPEPVRMHLLAERRLSRFRLRSLRWTLERLGAQLGTTPYPRVLLKGSAYVAQDLAVARGRLPADLDILVARADLDDVRRRLLAAEWTEAELDDHDRRYYLEWSHELPPMQHPALPMELDVHHGILPPTSRVTVDSGKLLARTLPSPIDGWRVLCPADQVLHAAAHLFHDSELRDRMRDLVDLDGLIRHFAQRHDFWDDLIERSTELGLQESLWLAVHFTERWLALPVPGAARRTLERIGPAAARRAWLLPLLETVLMPTDPDATESPGMRLAGLLLLTRHHWGRLPPWLLVPHIWHKWNRRRAGDREGDDGA